MPKQYYEHPVFKRIYGDTVVTPRIPLAWPHLLIPREAPDLKPEEIAQGKQKGAPRYELIGVLYRSSDENQIFYNQIADMLDEMLIQYNVSAKKRQAPGLMLDEPFIDGNSGKFDLEKYPYYADAWLMTARNTNIPVFKNAKAEKFFDASVFKGGDIGRCEITPHLGATGLSFKLVAVQLIKRGLVAMGGFGQEQGALLAEEEDGEDLVAAGAPAVVIPVKQEIVAEASDDDEGDISAETAADNAFGGQYVPPSDARLQTDDSAPVGVVSRETTRPQRVGVSAEVNTQVPSTTVGPVLSGSVNLSGAQLAENLKASAIAAAKAQSGQIVPPKEATVIAAVPPVPPVATQGRGKAAAVNML